MELLHEPLLANAERLPEKTALIEGPAAVTYAELGRRVRRLAEFLAERLQPGERFGVLLPNSVAAAVGLYGASAAGLIAVPLDADVHPRRAARLVEDGGIGAILTDGRGLDRFPAGLPLVLLAGGEPAGSNQTGLESVLAGEPAGRVRLPARRADDVACILYTAGTTGTPKGVMLTHRNLAAAARNIVAVSGLDEWVVESLPMPLSHSFGFARLRCVMGTGGTAILERGFLRPERLIDRLLTHRVDSLASVPAGMAILLDRYLEDFRPAALRLRFIEIGSAPLGFRHRETLLKVCPGARVVMHYGLTESSRAAFLDLRAERGRWETVGRPAPGVAIRIAAGSRLVPTGEAGEIEIRSETNAAGYWRQPEATAEAFADGWLKTGDAGFVDGDGYLHLAGRAADMINLGGIKVSPLEIEEVLLRQEGVREAAVVGVEAPAEVSGAVIKAFLVLAAGALPRPAEELKRACLRELEAYKVPREFEIVAALPKTASGKVRRGALAGGSGAYDE